MFKKIKSKYYAMGAAITVGTLAGVDDAHADDPVGNNFSEIAENIGTSFGSIPALLAMFAYIAGVIFAIMGVLKIKQHVENPSQTPLKDGVVLLLVGGAFFALPIMLEAMQNSIDAKGEGKAVTGAILYEADLRGVD
ncbi:MAG: hypothetical protein ACLFP8_03135 [Alphaproteobacteria bacterium]